MKKIFLIISVLVPLAAGTPSSARAQSLDLKTYNISPRGNYNYIRLVPKDSGATMRLGDSCANQEGTFYFDQNSDTVLLCQGSPGAETWGSLSDVWRMQTIAFGSTLVSPSDEANAANINVGIGTTTPEFKLTLQGDGSILARGQKGGGATLEQMQWANFLWYPRKAALWAGSFSQTVIDDPSITENIGLYSVNFGYSMQTPNQGSTAYGGCSDSDAKCTNLGQGATVGGGFNNSATGNYSTIAGGVGNIANGSTAFIGGGESNTATGMASVVIGGKSNQALQNFSAVGGGDSNVNRSPWGTIAGGQTNKIRTAIDTPTGPHNTIGGGKNNAIIDGQSSFIGGGQENQIADSFNTIGSGYWGNIASGSTASAILGGNQNRVDSSADFVFIGGGESNTATGQFATVFSGKGNTASGQYSFIGGGGGDFCKGGIWSISGNSAVCSGTVINTPNNAIGTASVIAGGQNNTNSGDYAFIGGGGSYDGSSSDGGNSISASGDYSVLPGGGSNTVTGNHSFAGGRNVTVSESNTFAWNYDEATPQTFSTSNAFIVGPAMNVGIGTAAPVARLHVVATGTGTGSGGIHIAKGQVRVQAPSGSGNQASVHSKIIGYKDLAEIFKTTEDVEPGDILSIDRTVNGELKKSSAPYDHKVVGVVSTAPAILFEGNRMQVSPKPLEFTKGTKPPVALKGRVMVKVSLENGPIQTGDVLTSSSTPGHAMKSTDALKENGAIIGKALAPFKGGPRGETVGLIPVFIALH